MIIPPLALEKHFIPYHSIQSIDFSYEGCVCITYEYQKMQSFDKGSEDYKKVRSYADFVSKITMLSFGMN
jgi:hypothetical protein